MLPLLAPLCAFSSFSIQPWYNQHHVLPVRGVAAVMAAADDNAALVSNLKNAIKALNEINERASMSIDEISGRATIENTIAMHVAEMREAGMDEDEIVAAATAPAEAAAPSPAEEAASSPPTEESDSASGPAAGFRPGSCPTPAETPTSGAESWGRWSHSSSEISLELNLEDSTKAKDLGVEVAEGWLFVGTDIDAAVDGGADATPLLFGRLLQPVLADEVRQLLSTSVGLDPPTSGSSHPCCPMLLYLLVGLGPPT